VFQVAVRTRFAEVAEARGDAEAAAILREQVAGLRRSVEWHAWDGDWYLRAWFDDGTPLGSKANDECRIDSLPQSWAVLSGIGDADRANRAVDSALSQLVDRPDRLVKLFAPPFDAGGLNPGYIKGYVPGIRENGGQYTHAAVWLVQALAELGRPREAAGLWDLLNPVRHAETPEGVARYRIEPYVLAGDVYGASGHVGRGGWSWYTGSSGWLYRTGVEAILGLMRRGDRLVIRPCVPPEWRRFEIDVRIGTGAADGTPGEHAATYRITVENPDGVERGVRSVHLDGVACPDGEVPLRGDGTDHTVTVMLG